MKKAISILFCLLILVSVIFSAPIMVDAAVIGNDYPSNWNNSNNLDWWRMNQLNCTSFCAWRLYNTNGYDLRYDFSNFRGSDNTSWHAKYWGGHAQSRGIAVNNTPAVGAIAWSTAGDYGHVAWVAEVSGDNVTVEEYNLSVKEGYGRRTVNKNNFSGYIHFKDINPITLPDTSANIPNGEYVLQHKGSSKYVSMGISYSWGGDVFLWEGGSGGDQKLTFTRQSDNTYSIKSGYSGCAMDVRDASMADGAYIQQWDWVGGNNQRWFIVDCGNGYYKFISKSSGKALTVANNASANGTKIQQWSDNGGDAQRFRLIPTWLPTTSANIPNGVYALQHKSSGKYVSMGISYSWGGDVFLWEGGSGSDQTLTLTRQSDNTYSIKSGYSGCVLDVRGVSMADGAYIQQWDWGGGNNQRWFIVDCGNGYYKFISKSSGKALAVANNASANGTKIQQWSDNGGDAQRFRLVCQGTHSWNAWKTTKSPTCTATGTQEHVCQICNAKETQTLPASGHQWSVWQTIKPATKTETGTKTRTCSTCKKVETETIPKQGSSSVPVSSIKISETSKNMVVDGKFTLTASVSPSNATNKTITWTSSNSSVATVSSGKVTAKSPGTTTITAKSSNGKTAKCTITVHRYVSMQIGKTAAVQNSLLTTIDNTGAKPFKINGRTMLPVRFIGEKMGGTVKYVNDKTPITITSGKKKVELTLNSKTMYVIENDKKTKITIDVPAQKRNGRTYLPLRAISESLGFDVYYKQEGSAEYIIVNSPKMTAAVRNARLAEAKKLIQ